MSDEFVVSMHDIVKVYPNGVLANENINFSILRGEIHALVGENGAGKSTLMKILFGIEQPSSGSIFINEQETKISSISHALQLELGMVQQHFMLVPSLTVTENILLGAEITKGLVIDIEEEHKKAEELCKKYSFDINVRSRIQDLSVGNKQKVEILKVLYRNAKIIILDEPTAVLTPQETEELFKQLLILKSKGHTIVFISHKLREVKEICDRLTVMRKGKTEGTFNVKDVSTEDISNLMMGKEVNLEIVKEVAKPQNVALSVKDVSLIDHTGKSILKDISFDLREGLILGIVGVEGNGQGELIKIITGLEKSSQGNIILNNTPTTNVDIKKVRDASLSYIPSERMSTGTAPNLSISDNIAAGFYKEKKYSKFGLINWNKLHHLATEKIDEYTVKTSSHKTPIKMLSGGNIQKVVVAREFTQEAKVIVAEQPTRGIDIGAAHLIHKKLIELRNQNKAVLLVSSDLTETLSLSDSIIVMFEGSIVAYFENTENLTENDLGLYMLGVKKQSIEEVRRCIYE